jgi:hypothetical protein
LCLELLQAEKNGNIGNMAIFLGVKGDWADCAGPHHWNPLENRHISTIPLSRWFGTHTSVWSQFAGSSQKEGSFGFCIRTDFAWSWPHGFAAEYVKYVDS